MTMHYAQTAGLSAGSIGAFILLVALAYIVAGPWAGRLADRTDCRKLMRGGLTLGSACYVALAVPSPPLFLPAVAMGALGAAEAFVVIPAFPAMTRAARRELDETTASALTSAAFNAAWSAGEGLGPVLGVWPMQHWGFAPTMVACACCLGMVAAALLGPGSPPARRKSTREFELVSSNPNEGSSENEV